MEEKFNNALVVSAEDGTQITISVLDIVESEQFHKNFIIYSLLGENKTVFASILNETDTTFSLDTINNPEELRFISGEIERVADEVEEELL